MPARVVAGDVAHAPAFISTSPTAPLPVAQLHRPHQIFLSSHDLQAMQEPPSGRPGASDHERRPRLPCIQWTRAVLSSE